MASAIAGGGFVCHYEVLGVPRDADDAAIKKAHRRLARELHPDRQPQPSRGADADAVAAEAEDSAAAFRRVQEAYECLSDPQERHWYDEHRSALLRGWSVGDGNDDSDIVLDLTPYMVATCYRGFDAAHTDSFYRVYSRVFDRIRREELDHGDPTADGGTGPLELPTELGADDTPEEDVLRFYAAWDGFTTSLRCTWADVYRVPPPAAEADPEEGTCRRARRAMKDENEKLRRAARRSRNEAVAALLRFLRRRDPRLARRRERLEREAQRLKAKQERLEKERRAEARIARDAWRRESEQAQAAAEEADLLAGRIRLADLDDDYDYGGGKRGKKKKGKNKKHLFEDSDKDEDGDDAAVQTTDPVDDGSAPNEAVVVDLLEEIQGEAPVEVVISESGNDESSEPDLWRCECCRKDFKSEAQFDNHCNSKKHKVAFKKWQTQQDDT